MAVQNNFSIYRELRQAFVAAGYATPIPDAPSIQIAMAVRDLLGQSISVLTFGAVGDGVTDNTVAMQAARDALVALAAAGQSARLVFPAGTYAYSVSPNWAIQDAEVEFLGEVRFRYTGTGNAVILDGDSDTTYNVKFGVAGRVLIECPSTAQNAIYARNFHASLVRAKVLGAGTTYAGLRVDFAVCTVFDVIVSRNHEDWYLSSKPQYGYYLSVRTGSEYTSYCTFPNPIVEATDIGIYLHATLGNKFFGGTSEGCTTYGVQAGTNAKYDVFYGTDFEANTTADVACSGRGIVFRDCDSTKLITFIGGANECEVVGGQHEDITLDDGSQACTAHDLRFNRTGTGAVVVAGVGNRAYNLTDALNDYVVSDAERNIIVEDDFLGDAVGATWNGFVGTDPQCVAPAVVGTLAGGAVRLTAGDDAAASMAVNGVQMDQGFCQWSPVSGGFAMEFRIRLSAITSCAWFIGMTDQAAALEMPFTLGAADVLTSNASDAVGVLFDTGADTDQWCLVGVAADVDATKQFAGVAPVANTWESWRMELSFAGTVARFFRNGALIGTAMTGATTAATLLTPVIAGFSRTTATRSIDCDRIGIRIRRV